MTYFQTWTLEGNDSNDYSVDVEIEYSFKFGTPDSWTEPGDAPEAEIESVYLLEDFTYDRANPWINELSLTLAEEEKVLDHIYQNPPEPDYGWEDY